MTTDVTTVTLPRDLFDRIAILAKREHRSARGQILHLLSTAVEDIKVPHNDTNKHRVNKDVDYAARQREIEAIFAATDAASDIDYATGLPKRVQQ